MFISYTVILSKAKNLISVLNETLRFAQGETVTYFNNFIFLIQLVLGPDADV